jgi:hypothetical protein
MSEQSDTYGFIATLDGDQLNIADSMGGGTYADVTYRREAVEAIKSYIRDTAQEVAEAIADDLDLDDDESDEDD